MTKDRIRELEEEFITWSNILDEELIRYNSDRSSYPIKYLLKKDAFFHDLLEKLDHKNEEYIRLTGLEFCHPNFEKAMWRLEVILDLIYCEIESRRT